MVEFSNDQLTALAGIERFIERGRPGDTFSVQGLAGTGKTYVAAHVARQHPGATICAFTGKAASLLRERTGLEVSTVHSAIYDYRGTVEDELDPALRTPVFTPKDVQLRLVILDESSMIGTRVARDLLATDARVLAFGDPGQLPPVADSQYFTHTDYGLTTIHRQALESAIVRQAHRVRRGEPYESDGDDFQVTCVPTETQLLTADAALCWRNSTRRALNRRLRTLRLAERAPIDGRVILAGEPVMCLRNSYEHGVWNGAIYDVATDWGGIGETLVLNVDGRQKRFPLVTVEGCDPCYEENRHDDCYLPFALAYAATVHKAQGSEWENVLLIDEYSRGTAQERRQWLYTGITRAVKRITVVRR